MIEIYPGKKVALLGSGRWRFRANLTVKTIGKVYITFVDSTVRVRVDDQRTHPANAYDESYRLVDLDDPELIRRQHHAAATRAASNVQSLLRKFDELNDVTERAVHAGKIYAAAGVLAQRADAHLKFEESTRGEK